MVMFFMIVHYRLPGLVASGALIYYALVVYALFRLVPVTLTLAGIAGFVLSVGMAVDANILIFERTKEELRVGKSLPAAIEAGFNRAWNSILDSNVSSLITATILFLFGSSTIRGFGLVLIIGVLVSLFSAITVTRTVLRIVVAQPWARKAGLYGVTEAEFLARPTTGRAAFGARRAAVFDIIGKRNWFFALSLAVTIPGLIFILLGPITGGKVGLQFAIDFTGGTVWSIRFQDPAVTPAQVKDAIATQGLEASVTKSGDGFMEIRTEEVGLLPPAPSPTPAPTVAPSASAGASASPLASPTAAASASPSAGASASPAASASPGASAAASPAASASPRRAPARPRRRPPPLRPPPARRRRPRPRRPAPARRPARPPPRQPTLPTTGTLGEHPPRAREGARARSPSSARCPRSAPSCRATSSPRP